MDQRCSEYRPALAGQMEDTLKKTGRLRTCVCACARSFYSLTGRIAERGLLDGLPENKRSAASMPLREEIATVRRVSYANV